MNKEFNYPAERTRSLHYSVLEVIKDPREFMLNNFQLEGKTSGEAKREIIVLGYLALFPKEEGDYFSAAFVNANGLEEVRKFYGEITRLEFPQKVKDLRVVCDPLLTDAVTRQLAQSDRPSIIIVKGKESSTGEALTFLFCPQGMLPKKALSLAQKTASDKYWELTAKNN